MQELQIKYISILQTYFLTLLPGEGNKPYKMFYQVSSLLQLFFSCCYLVVLKMLRVPLIHGRISVQRQQVRSLVQSKHQTCTTGLPLYSLQVSAAPFWFCLRKACGISCRTEWKQRSNAKFWPQGTDWAQYSLQQVWSTSASQKAEKCV